MSRKSPSPLTQTIIERVKSRLADLGWSAETLDQNAGLKRGTTRASLFLGSSPSSDNVAALSHALGVTADWLLGRTSEQDSERSDDEGIPIYGTASAADPTGGVLYMSDGEEIKREPLPRGLHRMVVSGDSMMPLAFDGQEIWVTEQRPQEGDVAVIETKAGEIYFKRVHFHGKDIHCLSINQDFRFKPLDLKESDIARMRRVVGTWWY